MNGSAGDTACDEKDVTRCSGCKPGGLCGYDVATFCGDVVEISASSLSSVSCGVCAAAVSCGERDLEASGGGGGARGGGGVCVRFGRNAGISMRCDFPVTGCEIDGLLSTGARRCDFPLPADVDLACGGGEPEVLLDKDGDRSACGSLGAGRLGAFDDTAEDGALACC